MKEYFLFLKSNDSVKYYPKNEAFYFTAYLTEPIHLENGPWYCALRAIKTKVIDTSDLYVYCDIIEESHVLGSKLPILQRIIPNAQGQVAESFDSSIHFEITSPVMNSITVYIRTASMAAPSVASEATTCTLHFFQK